MEHEDSQSRQNTGEGHGDGLGEQRAGIRSGTTTATVLVAGMGDGSLGGEAL